ncbi:MAG TPA: cation:proton antiporter [Thermoplasmata archaeon]|jgi:cell volume regulation protein A
MEEATIGAILAIGAAIFIGFFGDLIFRKLRVPDVLFLIALGIVIGPEVLGKSLGIDILPPPDEMAMIQDIFLTVALAVILFDGGLNTNIKAVVQSMRLSLVMAVLTLITEITLVALVLHFVLDLDLMVSLLLGSIIGGPTSAIVIPVMSKMRVPQKTKAMLVMESVLTDVLVIVTAITIINVIQIGEVEPLMIAWNLAVKFLVGGLVGLGAGIGWLFVLQKLRDQPLSYMLTVGALFIIVAAVEISPINSSGAVAALAFGLTLGNREFVKKRMTSRTLTFPSNEHIQHFSTEITFFVRTFFFVYLGLMFSFSTFGDIHMVAGLVVISVICLSRRMTSIFVARIGDLEEDDANAVFASMPRGLAAAVLATLPATALEGMPVWENVPAWIQPVDAFFLNVVLIVIVGTTVISTILAYATERGIDKRRRIALRRRLAQDSEI